MTRVRFAPTPSGNLFLGAARVALANYLFARRSSGTLLLRLDDLEAPDVPAEQIQQDLRWLGIDWDRQFSQSERLALYHDAIERLKRDKLIYPCFESPEELRAKQEFRRKRGQPAIYDRAMLKLTDKQRTDAEAGGKRPHWRLRLSGRVLEWKDMTLGARRAALNTVSDPILVRHTGAPTPILASVIDDIDCHITHIIRGEDNAGNTAIQLELFELLTGRAPAIRFAHLPPLADSVKAGRRVSGLSLRGLRNDGIEPCAVAAAMTAFLPAEAEPPPLPALAGQVTLPAFAAAGFDTERMLAVNRGALRRMEYTAVADRLPGGATEAFWLAIRGSLDLLKEARGWWDVVAGTIVPPVIDDGRDLLLTAGTLLPPEPWDHGVWTRWIAALEDATDRSGDALLTPLRLALTGEDSGPDLADLLPLIGRSRAASRLAIAAA
jgi:glutamyl-tRNA synthetase